MLGADKETREARFAICKQCKHYNRKFARCKLCGCVMIAKVALKGAKCPDGKW